MNEFYINLPSNTHKALDSVRENTSSNFRVRLPRDIRLHGAWEVALVEVQYPFSWDTVADGENTIKVLYANRNKDKKQSRIETLYLPTGNYSDTDQLLAGIQVAYEGKVKQLNLEGEGDFLKGKIYFNYDRVIRRFVIGSAERYVIYLSDKLGYMMGFNYNVIQGKGIADHPPDLRGGIDSLYVYCNLAEPQIVGDTMEPLLRILPVRGNYGDIVHCIFDSPHYVNVLQKEFSSVTITIKTDRDLPVPFRFGKSVVKLHFRLQK